MSHDVFHARLMHAVRNLSLPADQQAARLVKLGIAPSSDELALEFDDAVQLLPELRREGRVTNEQAALIEKLNERLTAMSGAANAALWDVDALAGSQDGAEVRALARQVLASP